MAGFYEPTVVKNYIRVIINNTNTVKFKVINVIGKKHRCKEFQIYFSTRAISLFNNAPVS